MAETMAAEARQKERRSPLYTGSCDICRKSVHCQPGRQRLSMQCFHTYRTSRSIGESPSDMKRPTCGTCDRHHWACAYTALRKKPGPRQGSRQASTVAVQRRLELLEGLLDSNLQRASSRDPMLSPAAPRVQLTRVSDAREEPLADQNQTVQFDSEMMHNDATLQLQSFTAALRWHGYTKRAPSVSGGGEAPTLSPLAALPEIQISESTERQLLSHFFTDVKLPIPVLCEEKFYREYEAKLVPRFLLDAMFSLSGRFLKEPEILELTAAAYGTVGSYFNRKASAEIDFISGNNGRVSVAEVTATYLLACHDITSMPCRKAAENCAKVVRLAYMAGLHQIDNISFTPQATEFTTDLEMEEKRCLWWGIFMLDTFSSLSAFMPPNIEDLSIASCLPTTVISQTSSQHVFGTRRACLDDDLSTFWSIVLHQESTAIARTQAVLIYVTAMAREVTATRRLCLENPRCNLTIRLNTLRQKWELMLSTLPTWFFDPTCHDSEIAGDDHRKRLETLIMIHTLGAFSSYPPLDLCLKWPTQSLQQPTTVRDRWRDCVFHAQKIADIYRSWKHDYCEKGDALILPMTWNAVCLLILHAMNKDYTDPKDKLTVWDSVDLIMNCLHKFSQHWNIASILMDSLEDLRAKSWRKVDTTTISLSLLTLSAPQMHGKSPTKVSTQADNAGLSSGEHDVEAFMTWPTSEPWLLNTNPSAPFDWVNLIAETQPLS